MNGFTDRELGELVSERRADYLAEAANTPEPSTKAKAKRKQTALECARRLEAATNSLNAFMRACNDCRDASASLESQGKGIDGRTKLIHEMSEYAAYLVGRFST